MDTSYPHMMCFTHSAQDIWWKILLNIWGRREFYKHETIPFLKCCCWISRYSAFSQLSGFWSWLLFNVIIRTGGTLCTAFQEKGTTSMARVFPWFRLTTIFFVQVLDKVGSVKPWNWLLLTIILFSLKLVDCVVLITIYNSEVTCFSGIRQEFFDSLPDFITFVSH